MRYDTLLFDADGTLLDFERSEREAVIASLAAFGVVADDEIVASYSTINDSLWKLLERGEIKKDDLKVRRFSMLAEKYGFDYDAVAVADRYPEELATKSYILGNALEVCTSLSKTCRLYLITNGFVKIQRGRFMPTPLYPLFSGLFISDEIGIDKPAPCYFDAVKRGIPNFDASKSLVIGDSLTSDMRGGINAGIDVCWFNPKGLPAPQDMKLDYIIGNLDKLYDITK